MGKNGWLSSGDDAVGAPPFLPHRLSLLFHFLILMMGNCQVDYPTLNGLSTCGKVTITRHGHDEWELVLPGEDDRLWTEGNVDEPFLPMYKTLFEDLSV
ncbi:TlpA family protein disulfide reductase [Sesbania bispinosa]|nr:TlpA family protein disulfide reductase [Sesbania bispinosa]